MINSAFVPISRRLPVPFLALALTSLLVAGCSSPAPVPDTITDINGGTHRLFGSGETRGTVLIFIEKDCPIANSYAPEISRIVEQYPQFSFLLVQVDPDLTDAEARRHAQEYALRAPVTMDRNHALVHLAGASVTPEAAVFSRDRERLYLGRIDDRSAGFGKSRPEPTRRDLRDSLDAILAGRPVPAATTKAIGCYIPDFARRP